jgi:hypothetical protein
MAIGSHWQAVAMTPLSNDTVLFWPLLIAGIGNAFTFSPLFVAIIGGVPPQERPKAAAITSVTIQLAGALATSLLISNLHQRTAVHQSALAASANLSRDVMVEYIRHHGLAQLTGIIEDQAVAYAYADVALIIFGVAISGIVLALLLGPTPAQRAQYAAPVSAAH